MAIAAEPHAAWWGGTDPMPDTVPGPEAMVLSMFFFGGPSLHYFALALTIGILFGIYSSVFVAAAIAMWLGVKREDLIKTVKKEDEDPNDPNAGATV